MFYRSAIETTREHKNDSSQGYVADMSFLRDDDYPSSESQFFPNGRAL